MPKRTFWLGWVVCAFAISACSRSGNVHRVPPVLKSTITPSEVSSSPPDPAPTSVPSPTWTSTPICAETTGTVVSLEYPAVALPGVIPVRVYQPPCYPENETLYPSIYLLHGYPFDESQWEQLGTIETVETGFSELRWPSVLLVMPRVPEPLFTKTDGGPGSYEAELIEGLVPFIDANFSTNSQASHRALVGLSRGGVWALEAGLRHPEIFDTVVALSPSLSVNSARPPYDPMQFIQEDGPFPNHILVTAGTAEPGFLKGIRDFVSLLRSNRVDHQFLLTSGAHTNEAWMEILDQVLLFAIRGVSGEEVAAWAEEYPEPQIQVK